MSGSGGEGDPASSGTSQMSDYLDRPNAVHRSAASLPSLRSGTAWADGDGPRVVGTPGREDRRAQSSRRRRPSLASLLWPPSRAAATTTVGNDNKGGSAASWRGWRPVRALAHLGKRSAECLLSVEVDAARSMPASMEGSRLAVTVHKAETRDGAVRTMPCRVRDGAAEFDETLFVWCYLYFTGGAGTGKPLRLQPRRFVVSVVSVEGRGAVLGTHTVDISKLVLESLGRFSSDSEGRRVRWFQTFAVAGGELQLNLGVQLMEDAGLSLYTQAAGESDEEYSPSSVSSRTPKLSLSDGASISPSMRVYKQLGDDELSASTSDGAGRVSSLPHEYDIMEKGVETVKEVVHYRDKRDVRRELDSNGVKKPPKAADQQQRLDADEEMVTTEELRRNLQVDGVGDKKKLKLPVTPKMPDLGRGIGPAVQTRDGGFLVSMNPFDLPLASRDGPPKLAMQVSRPFVLPGAMAATGFDVLQNLAAAGSADVLRDRVASLGGMDNITGKTPEQVRFEGVVAAVIGGGRRGRTEGATRPSAARSVRLVRKLATALSEGRSEREDDPETLDEVLAFSLLKLEAMAVDALAVQAEMADDDAPFQVSATAGDTNLSVFDSLVPWDEWSESAGGGYDGRVTLVAAIQVRDPWRRYEAVGAPMVAVVQSVRLLGRFEVQSLHVGGVQMRCPPPSGGGGSAESQKLTAMQWMLAHGPAARAGKRATTTTPTGRVQRPDVLWNLSSQMLAGMWLKTVRNPDVSIGKGSAGVTTCSMTPLSDGFY